MQDLDIRGAGNLLGAEQSGFVADLGYETYQKILTEAVHELKTDEFAELYADEIKGEGQISGEEFVDECQVRKRPRTIVACQLRNRQQRTYVALSRTGWTDIGQRCGSFPCSSGRPLRTGSPGNGGTTPYCASTPSCSPFGCRENLPERWADDLVFVSNPDSPFYQVRLW